VLAKPDGHASLPGPEVMRMAKNVKMAGQEQNNKNNHDGCGHKNPPVFIGHDFKG
jgi:hypothetical protein